jgi:hypothetical protein
MGTLRLVKGHPKCRILEFVTSRRASDLDCLDASPEYREHLEVVARASPHSTSFEADSICNQIAEKLKEEPPDDSGIQTDSGIQMVGVTSDDVSPVLVEPFLRALQKPTLLPGLVDVPSAEEARKLVEFLDIFIVIWKDKDQKWLKRQLGQLNVTTEKECDMAKFIVIYPDKKPLIKFLDSNYYTIIDCVNDPEEIVGQKVWRLFYHGKKYIEWLEA